MSGTVNRWQTIWSGKNVEGSIDGKTEFEAFCFLKEADGFDVAVENREQYFRAFYDEFILFYDRLNEICKGSVKSVYEVGCGSGVNLFLLKQRIDGVILGAVDYSEKLLDNAVKIAGEGDFTVGEAADIDTELKYDVVFADSVFEYFPSVDYASIVLRKMIEKSSTVTCVLGVYDKELEKELMNYRRSVIPDYDKRYEGLPKGFYSREWIKNIASEYGRNVEFRKPDNPEYWNAAYQFDAYVL